MVTTITHPPRQLVTLARRRRISRVRLGTGDWVLMLPDLPRAAWDDLFDIVQDYRDARDVKLRAQIARRRREVRRGRVATHREVWAS